ncbi:MAG TPA: DUF3108 domain-containing protein [Vulgatibacter sp.]|nr:DUF3108 domain-containing protein [Vulgatibacter sp.]
MRTSTVALAAALAFALPSPTRAARKAAVPKEKLAAVRSTPCEAMPAPSQKEPWPAGERLSFEIDVMGASAGNLVLMALPPVGKGTSRELPLRALAASNSFFSKVRRVRGRSTSYVRARDMHPRRYEEESNEDGVHRSANVVFQRPSEGAVVKVDWRRDEEKGRANLRYANDAFDPVSAAYFLRTVEFEKGQNLCFDSYGIRKLWRVQGEVVGKEQVRVPAGSFEAWHLEGVAVRTDDPRSARELHIWISADERRLPLAALGVLDLGAVRAQLTQIGKGPEATEASIVADLERPLPKAPKPAPAARPRPR